MTDPTAPSLTVQAQDNGVLVVDPLRNLSVLQLGPMDTPQEIEREAIDLRTKYEALKRENVALKEQVARLSAPGDSKR